MKVLICFLALALSLSTGTLYDDFQEFKSTYNRNYANPEEETKRYQYFRVNMEEAQRLAQANPLASFGMTKFTDWSKEEVKNFLNAKVPDTSKYVVEGPGVPAANPVDWRNSPGVVTSVKDQGQCGTCWSFASIGTVEGAWAVSGHVKVPPVSFSEQELLDCSGTVPDAGPYGIGFIIQNGGINSFSAYPYSGNCGGACNTTLKAVKVATVKNVQCLKNGGPESDILNWLQKSPMAISLAGSTLVSYRSGIMTTCSDRDLNHSVTLVGYGTQDGTDYWILKNSWGPNWGENGYFKLKYGVNCLGLAGGGPCQASN
jgi:KDEL-tailed cysteine endopeptidase